MALSAALVLLSRLDEQGPRERRELFGYWAKEGTILDAVDLGWVTYERDVVTLTERGRRALDGWRRRERFGQTCKRGLRVVTIRNGRIVGESQGMSIPLELGTK